MVSKTMKILKRSLNVQNALSLEILKMLKGRCLAFKVLKILRILRILRAFKKFETAKAFQLLKAFFKKKLAF